MRGTGLVVVQMTKQTVTGLQAKSCIVHLFVCTAGFMSDQANRECEYGLELLSTSIVH